jgi:hypothetical protein
MAITIPDRTQIRITTKFTEPHNSRAVPAVASVAMTNPGPVVVDTTANAAGQAKVKPATHALRLGYLGYNLKRSCPAGIATEVIRNGIVDGFAGCVIGSPVYIDTTSADATGTASGLTHTDPGTGMLVGVALTTTKISFNG